MTTEKENSNLQQEFDLTLDYSGKRVLSSREILALLIPVLLPEEFLGIDAKTIVDKYLTPSVLNGEHVDLKNEEVFINGGKKTRYDLHFEIETPSSKTIIVNLELQRSYSKDLKVRALVYLSKLIAEQAHKEYSDFNAVVSGWINFEPLKKYRNSIIVTEMASSQLILEGNNFKKKLIEDYENPLDLIKIVEINIGGPKYDNFKGIIKFIYDLFHCNKLEVEKFLLENNIENFDLEEILKPVMEYMTLDEQVRNEGRKEGRQEGRQEKAKEVYKRLLKEGFPEEKAHYLAYGTQK